MYPINIKTAKPIRSKNFVGPHMTSLKVNIQSFENLSPTTFDFLEILKIQQNIVNPQNFSNVLRKENTDR